MLKALLTLLLKVSSSSMLYSTEQWFDIKTNHKKHVYCINFGFPLYQNIEQGFYIHFKIAVSAQKMDTYDYELNMGRVLDTSK